MTAERRTFNRLPNDHATYNVDDPGGAIRLARSAPFIGCDIETGSAQSERRWNIKAFSIADTKDSYVLDPSRPQHRDAIRMIMRSARKIVFHNGGYDVPALVAANLMAPRDIAKVVDTIITSRLCWPDARTERSDLASLADRVLGPEVGYWKRGLSKSWKTISGGKTTGAMFDTLTLDSSTAYTMYACWDPLVTARIYAALPWFLEENLNPGLPGFRPVDAAALDAREQVVNRVLLKRSALGLGWDTDAADEVAVELQQVAAVHRVTLAEAGLDPDLPAARLKGALLAQIEAAGHLPPSWPRLKDGSLTTSNTWMQRLAENPMVEVVHDLLQAERWVRDYVDSKGNVANLVNGRVRPQVGVQNTVTGRMTYSAPNLQQVPPQVRRLYRFDAPTTSFDWSSIEPVVAAALARDAQVYESYEAGGDLYQPIADRSGTDRKTAKTTVLAQLYGQGAAALAFRLNRTEDEAREIVASVRAAMPKVSAMIGKVSAYGRQYGAIQTISGRRIPIPVDFKTGNRFYQGYKGPNYLIQGSAYDLLAETIATMHEAGISDELHLAVHDELVVSSSVADEVEGMMTRAPDALVAAAGRTPVLRVGRTDLGNNWQAKEN